MLPTFTPSSLHIAKTPHSAPQRQDVVVFVHRGETIIKRVAYLPGELVLPDDNYGLFAVVPVGCVWVLGDNRDVSEDSRDFGAIPVSEISGIILF